MRVCVNERETKCEKKIEMNFPKTTATTTITTKASFLFSDRKIVEWIKPTNDRLFPSQDGGGPGGSGGCLDV